MFKPGDIVKIVNKRGEHWNSYGAMDGWMGKIVTIRKIDPFDNIYIVDDRGEWSWDEIDFIPASNIEISNYLKERKTCLK